MSELETDRPSDSSELPGYSIRVAARRAGVRQDTIRAWERRYGALEPSRTEGGHRLYSDRDVERLRLLRLATEVGHRIGQIAALSDPALRELVETEAAAGGASRAEPATTDVLAGPRLEACLAAIERLDGAALERELERASVELPRGALVELLLEPLIEAVGERWDEGRLRPAHEHLASSVVSAFVQTFRGAFAVEPSAPTLVVSTPVHQHHELGATLAAAVAAAEGWRVIYLGPNLPAEEIAAAARTKEATAVALSVVFPPDDRLVRDELRRLRRLLEPQTALVVGGRAARAYEEVLAETDAAHVPDFKSFRRVLTQLRSERAAGKRG